MEKGVKRKLAEDVFQMINKKWALVAAGTLEAYGCMTVAWGGFGALWVKPVITVYIKPSRNTHDYLMNNEYFSVSFFAEAYRDDLITMGTLSGRNCNKVSMTSLTPIAAGNSVAFSQASTVYLCKKIYWQRLDVKNVPEEIRRKYYEGEEPHTMFIGEIVETMQQNC